eukprot:jgi/Picre1/36032/NNA_003489.t1
MVYIACCARILQCLVVNFLFRLHIKNIEMQRSIALKGAPSHQRVVRVTGSRVNRVIVRADADDNGNTAVKERKPSPLERGGTLSGAAAAGKDASDKFKAMAEGVEISGPVMQITEDGKFRDYRWSNGRWDMNSAAFKGSDGEIDWDLVIDAEMARRKLLEDTPIPSTNEEPVLFDTAEIPWWAWVRRFHLPEAEKLNGRAAMLGYVLAIFVDKLTGAGLIDQQESFLGKLALHICVFGVLFVRNVADIDSIKNLIDEATFYDKQWTATWENQERPDEE